MNVHVSYKHGKLPEIENEIQQQVAKLQPRLQVFRPELVHLHAGVEELSKNGPASHSVSLNLRLPTGQLAALQQNGTAVGAARAAFAELSKQLNKHKELLREGRFRGPRKLKTRDNNAEIFAQTSAAVHPETVQAEDIHLWVAANLKRLEAFVERELWYRVNTGQIERDMVSKEEVVDEVIAAALGEEESRPEKLSLERWLYRLAIQSIRRLSADNREPESSVHLESPARTQNVTASDDARMQFHQPDDEPLEEAVLADTRIATPEQVAASDEMIQQVEDALASALRPDREAFILFGIEGFTIAEIASITDRQPEQVLASINAARDHLKQRMTVQNPFAQKILEHTKVPIASPRPSKTQPRKISA